ncbi:MAG: hypothetical protein A3F12_01070 [Gammaproteobacteria bacterium RIFCSPHIGHO2_12_FULL_38_14]|nr:MAG: hypothetical protein A3F12_01070 [Gammaproteobacteria bacterium RIFCSPHIGHO2_12_FULL_38_14]
MKQTVIIPEHYQNSRLDQALAKLMPQFSRTQIQTWIEEGRVLVNGVKPQAKLRLKGGETVTIEPIIEEKTHFLPQAISLDILYEDEALLIVNKAAKMVTHPGAGNPQDTLLNALLHHCPTLNMLPRAGILHRLDKGTSGLLIVAKTGETFRDLSQQLKKRTLQREYQTIVAGRLISGGQVSEPIGRHPIARKRMAVVETGKKAVTHYRIIEKYRAHSHLRVQLETGRTHQIRVHMAHIGHPIVGDATYGGRLTLVKGMTPTLIDTLRHFKRQALHAYALGFTHPLTKELVRFESDLPEDMQQLVNILQKDKDSKK